MITFIKILLASLLGTAFVATTAIGIARVTLPPTACVARDGGIAALKLETMTYADVASKLGCQGMLTERMDYGPGLVEEVYSWRGDGWPYARFSGTFYNGVLHGTEHIRLSLSANLHEPQ